MSNLDFCNNSLVKSIIEDKRVKGTNSLRTFHEAVTKVAREIDRIDIAKQIITKGTDGFKVHPSLILEEEGFNPRNYATERIQESIDYLSRAYRDGDYVDPITVVCRDGRILVREGHTRRLSFRHAIENMAAELERVKVVEFTGSQLEEQLIPLRSNSGNDLRPHEKGVLMHRMVERFNKTEAEVAKLFNVSIQSVSQTLRYFELSRDVQKLVEMDIVSLKLATEAHDQFGADAAEKIRERMAEAEEKQAQKEERQRKRAEQAAAKRAKKQQPKPEKAEAVETAEEAPLATVTAIGGASLFESQPEATQAAEPAEVEADAAEITAIESQSTPVSARRPIPAITRKSLFRGTPKAISLTDNQKQDYFELLSCLANGIPEPEEADLSAIYTIELDYDSLKKLHALYERAKMQMGDAA